VPHKFSASGEPQGSFACSEKYVCGPHFKPVQSSYQHHNIFPKH